MIQTSWVPGCFSNIQIETTDQGTISMLLDDTVEDVMVIEMEELTTEGFHDRCQYKSLLCYAMLCGGCGCLTGIDAGREGDNAPFADFVDSSHKRSTACT